MRPTDIDRRLVAGREALVTVDGGGSHGGHRARVGHLPRDELVGDVGEMVGIIRVVEAIPAILIGEALMHMHPGAVDAKDRLGHKAGVQPVRGRNRADGVLERHGVVGGGERVRVAEIDLVLAGGDLVVRHLHVDAQRLRRQDDLAAHLLRLIEWREIEVAAHIMRDGFEGRVAIVLKEEVLQLRPHVIGVTQRFGLLQHILEHGSRGVERRRAVGIVNIADDAGAAAFGRAPRQDAVGRRIGDQHHVALLNAGEALDGGAIEPHALGQHLLELSDGKRDTFDRARDVGKLEADKLDVIGFSLCDQFLGHLFSPSPVWGSI